MWDAKAGQQVVLAECHTEPVISVCFSPDGTQVGLRFGVWTLVTEALPDGTQVGVGGKRVQGLPNFQGDFKYTVVCFWLKCHSPFVAAESHWFAIVESMQQNSLI